MQALYLLICSAVCVVTQCQLHTGMKSRSYVTSIGAVPGCSASFACVLDSPLQITRFGSTRTPHTAKMPPLHVVGALLMVKCMCDNLQGALIHPAPLK